jgi:hypothetical protein
MALMQDLSRALVDIAAMRAQLAKASEFRGYGPTTLAATGVLAAVAAVFQAGFISNPATDTISYLALWIATAALSILLIGTEVITRSRRTHTGMADEMLWLAMEQLLPSIAAGVLATYILARYSPQSLWLLPGLWQVFLSLGCFASTRTLPRPLLAIGFWYMGTGLTCLAMANGPHAFAPVAMGLPFGLGQMFAAIILRFAGETDEED